MPPLLLRASQHLVLSLPYLIGETRAQHRPLLDRSAAPSRRTLNGGGERGRNKTSIQARSWRRSGDRVPSPLTGLNRRLILTSILASKALCLEGWDPPRVKHQGLLGSSRSPVFLDLRTGRGFLPRKASHPWWRSRSTSTRTVERWKSASGPTARVDPFTFTSSHEVESLLHRILFLTQAGTQLPQQDPQHVDQYCSDKATPSRGRGHLYGKIEVILPNLGFIPELRHQ